MGRRLRRARRPRPCRRCLGRQSELGRSGLQPGCRCGQWQARIQAGIRQLLAPSRRFAIALSSPRWLGPLDRQTDPWMAEMFIDGLGRPAGTGIRKASNRHSGIARSKLWIPKDIRPAVWAKVKLHVLTAVARAREGLRRPAQRHLISIIKHRRAESAACTTLASMAMAGADLQRLTTGGDRQCATGAGSCPDVHGTAECPSSPPLANTRQYGRQSPARAAHRAKRRGRVIFSVRSLPLSELQNVSSRGTSQRIPHTRRPPLLPLNIASDRWVPRTRGAGIAAAAARAQKPRSAA